MKKFITGAVVVLGLSMLGSAAQADSFGVRTGYPFLGVQYTMGGAPSTPGLRFVLSSLFVNANLQADYLLHMPLPSLENFSLYYGGGANLDVAFGGGFGIGAQGTVGVEYQLTHQLSIFGDTSLGVTFRPSSNAPIQPYYGGGFGVNFRI